MLNTQGIVTAMLTYVVPLLLLFVGLSIMAKSNNSKMGKVMQQGGIAVFGLMFIVGGVAIVALANWIVGLSFAGGGSKQGAVHYHVDAVPHTPDVYIIRR